MVRSQLHSDSVFPGRQESVERASQAIVTELVFNFQLIMDQYFYRTNRNELLKRTSIKTIQHVSLLLLNLPDTKLFCQIVKFLNIYSHFLYLLGYELAAVSRPASVCTWLCTALK